MKEGVSIHLRRLSGCGEERRGLIRTQAMTRDLRTSAGEQTAMTEVQLLNDSQLREKRVLVATVPASVLDIMCSKRLSFNSPITGISLWRSPVLTKSYDPTWEAWSRAQLSGSWWGRIQLAHIHENCSRLRTLLGISTRLRGKCALYLCPVHESTLSPPLLSLD